MAAVARWLYHVLVWRRRDRKRRKQRGGMIRAEAHRREARQQVESRLIGPWPPADSPRWGAARVKDPHDPDALPMGRVLGMPSFEPRDEPDWIDVDPPRG